MRLPRGQMYRRAQNRSPRDPSGQGRAKKQPPPTGTLNVQVGKLRGEPAEDSYENLRYGATQAEENAHQCQRQAKGQGT